MNRLDKLRQEYAANRYLANLPLEELQKRINDIMSNIVRIDERGLIVPHKFDEGGGYWMDIFEHARHEMFLRFGPFPAGFDAGFIKQAAIPKPDLELAKRAAALLAERKFHGDRTFFKFGEVPHLRALLNEGVLRISPASVYSDPSLNHAIRDDELSVKTYPSDRPMPLQGYEPPDFQVPGKRIISVEAKAPTNYYVFCLSYKYSPRLPVDFSKTGVLEIRDVLGFSKKLFEATKNLLPDWLPGLGAVTYIDPLLPRLKEPNALFCKHFRFAYQSEVRYIWIPKKPTWELPHIEVRMGNLAEHCELHLL